MDNNKNTGFAIAIAWPQTLCKQAGAWYDGLMSFFNFNQNYYYKVGHAAIVLINKSNNSAHYFDFGRYHTPFGVGRVRNQETDLDLAIHTKPQIQGNKIDNLNEILEELINNPSCHGNGFIMASYTAINFKRAYDKAKKMQNLGTIKYGPFIPKGTNCSRFVNVILLSGKPKLYERLRLVTPYSISPTPKTNVIALQNRTFLLPEQSQVFNTVVWT